MRGRADWVALLVVALAPHAALGQEADAETPAAADAWVGIGYYHLPEQGGENRFEASYQLGQVGFRPLRRVADAGSGGVFEAGGLARVQGLVFSSRDYGGYRVEPGLGLDLLWSDAPAGWLFYTLALRPYVAYSFERSEIAADGFDTLDTVLAGIELAASCYRLAPPPAEPSVGDASAVSLRWFTELHVRVAYEHDLDPSDTSSPLAGASPLTTAEARRRVAGRGGSGGGSGGGAGPGGGLVELQDDERDLSNLNAELTLYGLTVEGAGWSLAAGGVLGLRQHRAAFYLSQEAGDAIHTLYGGPLVRVGVGLGFYAFASANARWEAEVDRVGGGAYVAVLWVF